MNAKNITRTIYRFSRKAAEYGAYAVVTLLLFGMLFYALFGAVIQESEKLYPRDVTEGVTIVIP